MRGCTLAPVALLAATACSAAPPPPRDIAARLPDGRVLDLYCAGAGAPTVLLDAGWTANSRAWSEVMKPLAARYRVCAYDRAGEGRSDPGPLPRDGAAIARDLDRAVRAAKIGGPFVVVGHSAGGLYVRHFAKRRHADVIGMVLVDATVPDQQRRLEAVYGPGVGTLAPMIDGARDCAAKTRADPAAGRAGHCALPPPAAERWASRASELETLFGATSADLAFEPSLRTLPLIVLTADRTYPPPIDRTWFALHDEIARRSSRGEARIVANSGHDMSHERPDAIVQAVDDVVARAEER